MTGLSIPKTNGSVQYPSPVAVIISAALKDTLLPGAQFTLSVTVSNKGKHSALFEVYIEENSPGIRQWCPTSHEHLALGAEQTAEVAFRFDVPQNTLPGIYYYTVVVDAYEHYPEHTPIRSEQYLNVLPGTGDLARSSDPTFGLQPVTTSLQPGVLQPGGALPFQVFVQNRGERVDRFRLLCTDLPRSWYKISYPQGFQGTGLVLQPNFLNLNPGDSGQIVFLITPPLDALAGSYVPTLRLYSENHPELVLLDLIYLQVPPTYLLQAELRTIISRVRYRWGLYQVRLTNLGNTERSLRLQVTNRDEQEICEYTLAQSQVVVQPKQILGINLEVKPMNKWQRPFYGGARTLNFSVDFQDHQDLPLLNDSLPGVLVWESRPWWQLFPLFLLGILGIAAMIYLIWWWLLRVPPSPKIFQFYPEDRVYSAVNRDVIRVGFAINEANRLQSLTIVGLAADGTPLTRVDQYDFSHGIPDTLKPFCRQQQGLLNCRQVRTSAKKPGTYVFEMTTVPKLGHNTVTDTLRTTPVTIAAIPPVLQPQILSFASTQLIYQQQPKSAPFTVQLNWVITHPRQLRALQLVGNTVDGAIAFPPTTYDLRRGIPVECQVGSQLVCTHFDTQVSNPGDYVFTLRAIPRTRGQGEMKKSEPIKILPKVPQILALKVNGMALTHPTTDLLIPIRPGKIIPGVVVSWAVDASAGSKVELLPAPGTVPLQGAIPFQLPPPPGKVTLMLQVTSTTGQQVIRSVDLATYDPNAVDPAVATGRAIGEAIVQAQKSLSPSPQPSPGPGDESFPRPAPALSPIEPPPQFP
jgi:hypothetical protein